MVGHQLDRSFPKAYWIPSRTFRGTYREVVPTTKLKPGSYTERHCGDSDHETCCTRSMLILIKIEGYRFV